MDRQTEEKLRMFGKRIPKSMKDAAIDKVDTMRDQREKAEKILSNNKVPQNVKRIIEQGMERGDYHKVEERVNENKARELNAYADKMMADDIKSGRLPDPKKFRNDEFFRRK